MVTERDAAHSAFGGADALIVAVGARLQPELGAIHQESAEWTGSAMLSQQTDRDAEGSAAPCRSARPSTQPLRVNDRL